LVWRLRGVRLVWITGADSVAQLARWQDWRSLAEAMPIAVVDRFGASSAATASPAAQALAAARIRERDARTLADRKPPAWVYLHGLKSPLSSTAIRATAS